jgi:hypothetical protein
MEDLGGKANEMLDFENLLEKAPKAVGGLLAAFGGFLAFVGFFLSWGFGASGLERATDYDQTLYFCIPCLGILIMLVGLASAAVPFLRREIPFLKPITGGLLILLSVFLLCPIFIEQDGAKIGWWCAPVGAVLIALGAVIALVLPTLLKQDLS